jgi:hypothetical protein
MFATDEAMPATCVGIDAITRRLDDVTAPPAHVAPPVLPHAVLRRPDLGLGALERPGVGRPPLLLFLLPLHPVPHRVDIHASPPSQLLVLHLAGVLVPVGLAQ